MGSKSTMPASVQFLVMCLPLEGRDSVIVTSIFGTLVGFMLQQDFIRDLVVYRELRENLLTRRLAAEGIHLKPEQEQDRSEGGLRQSRKSMHRRMTQGIKNGHLTASGTLAG